MTQATAMANYPQKYTWGILTYFLIFSASLLASRSVKKLLKK